MSNPKTVVLKLTSAIALAGKVIRAGELVEVTVTEAKDLLRRGKAEIADDYDPEADDVTPSGTIEPPLHPAIAQFEQDNADRTAERGFATDAVSQAVAVEGAFQGAQVAADAAAAAAATDGADATTDAAQGAQEAAGDQPKTDAAPAAAAPAAAPQGRRNRQAANATK